MSITNKIITEALTEDVYDDFLKFDPRKRNKRPKPSSDRDLEGQFLKCKEGDIVEANNTTYVLLSVPQRATRSANIEVQAIKYSDLAKALTGRHNAFGTYAFRAVQSFAKKGKLKPSEIKKIKDLKSTVINAVSDRQSNNSDAKEFRDGEYQVKMQDGNYAKAGDTVLVKFSNGNFPMFIIRVAGPNKENQIMVRNVNRTAGKSRGVPASTILKKV